MVRNIVQMIADLDLELDKIESPRFHYLDKVRKLNQATEFVLDDRINNIKIRKPYGFESSQILRDELSPLVVTDTGAPSSNVIAYPADYRHEVYLELTINGNVTYSTPITHDELGSRLYSNPILTPDENNPVHTIDNNGITIHSGSTNATAYTLYYIKNPAELSRGLPSDEIASGDVMPSAPATAIAIIESVYSGTTYYPGQTFASSGSTLTSGLVVDQANTTSSDMPGIIQDEIIKKAASLLEYSVEDFNKHNLQEQEISRG